MDLETLIDAELSGMAQAAGYALSGLVLAVLVSVGFRALLYALTRRTATDLDDLVARILRWPVALSVFLGGLWYAAHPLGLPEPLPYVVTGLLVTLAIITWTLALAQVTSLVLDRIVQKQDEWSVVTPRTVPVFDIAARTFLYGGAAYFLFLAWDVDPTGWLASAGIAGVAVGFAAKDTLSNLIAGVFILADAPYKLGDYLLLDSGERGEVVEIGIRTTRLLTRDDVEIIVPNATMANARITNESGGPHEKYRIRVKVGVAYGSDVDLVRQVLNEIAQTEPDVEEQPAPRVRFRAFGDSSLDFELLCWVAAPRERGRVLDALNTAVYKRFNAEAIEIPFPQRDVHLKQP